MAEWNDDEDDASPDPEGPDDSDVDDAETDPCPYCGKQVYEDTIRCPHCGKYINLEDPPPSPHQTWFWIGLVLALMIILLWIVW